MRTRLSDECECVRCDAMRSAGVAWCGVVWRGVAWRGVAWWGVHRRYHSAFKYLGDVPLVKFLDVRDRVQAPPRGQHVRVLAEQDVANQ
jgi:hypothetical protein